MINIFNKIGPVIKNMHFQSLFANGMMSVFGMVTVSILYRSLSVVDIGTYIFFLSIVGLADNLRGGFLTIPIIKFFSGSDETRGREIAGAGWLIAIIISSTYFLLNLPAYFLSKYVGDGGIVLFLKYFGIISIASLPNFITECLVQANRRFDRVLLLRIMTQGSYACFVLSFWALDMLTVTTAVYAYILSNLFSSTMVLSMGWTMIGSIKYANRKTIWEIFHFGKYSMGTNVSASLFGVTNTFLINFLIGPAALAVYNLAGKLMQIIEIPMVSLASSGMPILSAYYNRGEKGEMIYALKKLIGMLTISLVPLVIIGILLAEPIMHLIGGAKYIENEAPNLFRIFLIIGLLYPIDRFFALGVDVIHEPKVNFYKILLMLAINITGVFTLVSIYHSVYSVAVAVIPSTLAAVLITYYPLARYYKFSIWSIYRVGFQEVMMSLKRFFKAA